MGSVIAGMLAIISLLYMAMPIGIIGHLFTQTWLQRDQILLMHRTRARLRQWNYSPEDILAMFNAFGESGSTGLTFEQFEVMIYSMRMGLSRRRLMELFWSMENRS